MTIKERILHIAEVKGIAKEKLCEKIGMTYGNFRGEAKKRPLNSDTAANILSVYPDINADWLLTGNGNMLKKSEDDSESRQIDRDQLTKQEKEIETFNKRLMEKQKLMDKLIEINLNLQNQNIKLTNLLIK